MHSVCVLSFVCCLGLVAQDPPRTKKAPAAEESNYAPRVFTEFPVPEAVALDVEDATAQAIAALLRLPEGESSDQWPYEGVYREDGGNLPVGYRVGGTAIVCLALIAAPGYRDDAARQAAVKKGLGFVLTTLEVERMAIEFKGTYDVRGWGHIYTLQLLLHLADYRLVPDDVADAVKAKTTFLVKALVESAIPTAGGWNYARRAGYLSPNNRASTFMTPAALQALFHAKARGYEVPDQVVEEGLDALERARSKAAGYGYGASAESSGDIEEDKLSMMDKMPGSAARAAICETTLMLAGRGDADRLAASIDRFFAHWDDLAVRKSRTGTHVKPYGIAPYYFLFGHLYAAQAIEQVPDQAKREALRLKMREVLARSREEDGSWNDRQFARSAGYGTAMALLTLHMPRLPKPKSWSPGAIK